MFKNVVVSFLFLCLSLFELHSQSLFLTEGNRTLGGILGYASVYEQNLYSFSMPISGSIIGVTPIFTYYDRDFKFGGSAELFLLKDKGLKQPFNLSIGYGYLNKTSTVSGNVYANVLHKNKTKLYANVGFNRLSGSLINTFNLLSYGGILSTKIGNGFLFAAMQWTSPLKKDDGKGGLSFSIGVNGYLRGSKDVEKH